MAVAVENLTKHAELVVDVCMSVEDGDVVTIICDDVHFPMAPPRNLHQAMVASDEVIIVTNLEWANRFAHVSAVKETCAANGKIASVEEGMGTWDLTVEDIEDATRRAKDAI